MANSFTSVKNIARQTLVALQEALVFPQLVYNDFKEDYKPGAGATIQIRKPAGYTAQAFTQGSTVSVQDIKEESVDLTLDKIADVSVEYGAIEGACSVDDINRLFAVPAARAIAEKINQDGLALYKDIPYYTGTAGTTPDGLDDFANAAKILNENKAPTMDRFGVWDPSANAAFQQLAALVNAEKAGTTEALRAGAIGRVFGIDNYMSQGVKTHTNATVTPGGTAASGVKVKADVSDGDTIVGISNATGSATLTGAYSAGTILSIGSSGIKALVISANTASNEMTIKLDHAVTVSANDAITPVGNHVANLVFHRNAFAFATRPLSAPAGVESYTVSYNGISVRVCRGYDMTYKKEMLSADVLYGYKTLEPKLACVVLG